MLIKIIFALGVLAACTSPNTSEQVVPDRMIASSAKESAKTPAASSEKVEPSKGQNEGASASSAVDSSSDSDFAGLSDGTLVGARCPASADFLILEAALRDLGEETKDLVKDDLENLLKTSSRKDLAGITSCCNQVEQLVQDAEVMNEDRPNSEAALVKLHQLTKQLCPSRAK